MPRLLSEETTDFSRGTDDSSAATAFPRQAVQLLQNGRVYADGTIARRWGRKRKHAAAVSTGTGYGAVWFTKADGTNQIVAFIGTGAWLSSDKGVTWSSIATGLRQDYWSFASMRVGATNYLFCANGDTVVKRFDGTTMDDTPNAPSGVKYLAVFNGRLWYAGHSGVIVQATKIADPTVVASPDGLTIQILTHDGDPPTGLFQIGPHLLVFDKNATSYIDGFGEQTIIVATGATGFSRSVGCIAFRTIVGVGDNAVCWLSQRGVEYYSPSTGIQLLSRRVQQFLDEIDRIQIQSNPGQACAAYDEQQQDYHLWLSTTGTRNDRGLVINLQQRGQGWLGAPAIDQQQETSGGLLFGSDADGYLEVVAAGGYELHADVDGYVALSTGTVGGDTTTADAGGYLQTDTNDALPATIFLGPSALIGASIHSLGYDGFVREHYGVDGDDVLSDGSGGSDITMIVVARPFMFGEPRMRKRARVVHVASINEAGPASYDVAVRADGAVGAFQTIDIGTTAFGQSKRGRAMVSGRGDSLQVELRTTSRTRLTLVGMEAERLREPV